MAKLWTAVATALSLVLAGCATEAKFAAKIGEYVGKPESAIIMKMGPPDRAYALADGSRVLQWRVSRTVPLVLPGGTTAVRSNSYGQVGSSPGGAFTSTTTTYVPNEATVIPLEQGCTVNVTINSSGVMTAWSAAGNHCKSN